jgi:IPT/TIG domain
LFKTGGGPTRDSYVLLAFGGLAWRVDQRRSPSGERGMRTIKGMGLCAVIALAFGIFAAQAASARGARQAHIRTHSALHARQRAVKSAGMGNTLVLKAGGQIVPNGALVHVTAAAYFFKSKVTVEGTSKKAAKEEEVECATEYFEQGNIQRDFAHNAWRVVKTAGIDFCEGEEWFAGHAMEHPLVLTAPNVVTDESTVELFRTEEQIKEEEKLELVHEEPIHAREPKRCLYHTLLGHGRFRSKKGGPLEAKIRGKMLLTPTGSGVGCGPKAKWKATFTMTYKGMPISAAMEQGPTVTSVVPMEAPEAGTTVTIGGTGFTGASAVQFGATSATSFKVNSDTSITATAPSGSGTVDVRVTTPVGLTPATPADHFTYATRPTVTEIKPKSGSEAGGTEVEITGTNFTGGSTVHFGSTPATSVKFNSANSITATSPPGAGTLNVIVTNAGGTSMTSAADKFTYLPAPTVTALSPKEGLEAGGATVTITGTNFKEISEVKFGATKAPKFKVVSESSIEAESPSGTGTVNVTVTGAGGTSATSAADEFTYLPAPAVSGVSPKEGPEGGATTVTISGSHFKEISEVKFGATKATKFKVISEGSIEAESPAGTAGAVHVTVIGADGTSATSAADEFTYVPPPIVSSISPNLGPEAGGTVVTITGKNFHEVSEVKFGPAKATKFKVNSEESIEAESPPGTGTVHITVTTAGGTSATSAADEFTY